MDTYSVRQIITAIQPNPELQIGVGKVFESDEMSFYLARVEKEVPPHYHKKSDETYYVFQGQGEMRVDDVTKEIHAGDIVLIPKGSIHGLKNTGSDELIIFFISAPPFDQENDRFTE